MSKEDPPFGPRLRAARERAGLNKNQLARELSTSWQHVDNWERGRVQPSLGSVRRLAELLSVSSDFLLGLVTEPAPLVMSPLDQYLESRAPHDLSATEEQWLRDAPVDPMGLTPESYGQLLASLRGVSSVPPEAPREASRAPSSRAPSGAQSSRAQASRAKAGAQAKSGVQTKVDRAAATKPKRRSANRSSLSHSVGESAVAAAIADDDPEPSN